MPDITELIEAYRDWLYLPDPTVAITIWAAINANRLRGDAVWLYVVGPPGCGKTELLSPLVGAVDEAQSLDMFTVASLLTATPGGQVGGLLANFSENADGIPFGILVCKDFSTFLTNGGPDARGERFSTLRRIFDGDYDRSIGFQGGMTLGWKGKAGLIAAVTDEVDQHGDQMAALGHRYLYVRVPRFTRKEVIALQYRRGENVGREPVMRTALAEATKAFFDGLVLPDAPQLPEDPARLYALARFAVAARSHVGHDWHGAVSYINDPETPTRAGGELAQLYAGVRSLGLTDEWATHIAVTVALNSIPPERLRSWQVVASGAGPTSEEVGREARLVPALAERALRDLEAQEVVACDDDLRWWPGAPTEYIEPLTDWEILQGEAAATEGVLV